MPTSAPPATMASQSLTVAAFTGAGALGLIADDIGRNPNRLDIAGFRAEGVVEGLIAMNGNASRAIGTEQIDYVGNRLADFGLGIGGSDRWRAGLEFLLLGLRFGQQPIEQRSCARFLLLAGRTLGRRQFNIRGLH